MKKSNLLLGLLAMMVSSFVLCPLASAEWSPLPKDVRVVPPGPEIPPKLARFSGTWEGTFGSMMDGRQATLVVEEIRPSQSEGFEATVVYSWSGNPDSPAGWKRLKVAVTTSSQKDFQIILDSPTHRIEFSLIAKDQLRAYWQGKGSSTQGTFLNR
jgi:hypothetical protein